MIYREAKLRHAWQFPKWLWDGACNKKANVSIQMIRKYS